MDQEDGAQADEIGWKPEEDAEEIILDLQQPKKTARIGSRLSLAEKEELTTFLRENRDIFAWSPSDMPGIDPKVACHKLHVDPAAKPVIQQRRYFAPERVAIIEAGNRQAIGSQIHRRGSTLGMARQRCASYEEREGQVEGLRRIIPTSTRHARMILIQSPESIFW